MREIKRCRDNQTYYEIHFDVLYISNLFVLENDSKNNVIGLLEKINISREEEVLKDVIKEI